MKKRLLRILCGILSCMMLLCCALPLSGCQTYKDLDELLYITSLIMDLNEKGDGVVLYVEAFKPKRSSQALTETQERIIYKLEGDTVSHALMHLDSLTSSAVTMTHMKIFMITERLAQHGFSEYFDAYDRSQEISIRTKIALFKGDPQEYCDLQLKEDSNVGIYLFRLINNSKTISSYGVDVELKEFENQLHIGDRVNSMPIIRIVESAEIVGKGEHKESGSQGAEQSGQKSEQASGANQNTQQNQSQGAGQNDQQQDQMGENQSTQKDVNNSYGLSGGSLSQQNDSSQMTGEGGGQKKDQKLQIEGLALVYMYQLVGELEEEKPLYFNFLLENEVSGVIEVPHPIVPDQLCVLKILGYKLKSEGTYDGETYNIKRTIDVSTSFAESQADIIFDIQACKTLSREAEDKIEARCLELFHEYKEKGIDVFDIQEEFDRDYPEYHGKYIIKDTTLEVEAKVEIEGTTTTKNYVD